MLLYQHSLTLSHGVMFVHFGQFLLGRLNQRSFCRSLSGHFVLGFLYLLRLDFLKFKLKFRYFYPYKPWVIHPYSQVIKKKNMYFQDPNKQLHLQFFFLLGLLHPFTFITLCILSMGFSDDQ